MKLYIAVDCKRWPCFFPMPTPAVN